MVFDIELIIDHYLTGVLIGLTIFIIKRYWKKRNEYIYSNML